MMNAVVSRKAAAPNGFGAAFQAARGSWKKLAKREQTWLVLAVAVLGLGLLWGLAIAPALRTLTNASARQQMLDRQFQQMQQLQMQAVSLQAQPKISREDAQRALEAAVKQRFGGSAQLSITGDRATLSLKNAPADALALWLTQARVNARSLPIEVHLVRGLGARSPIVATTVDPVNGPQTATSVTWDGSLVVSLPLPQ